MNTASAVLRDALVRHPEAAAELPVNTFWRYANGNLPKGIVWLLRHPALLRTLATYAEDPHYASAHNDISTQPSSSFNAST